MTIFRPRKAQPPTPGEKFDMCQVKGIGYSAFTLGRYAISPEVGEPTGLVPVESDGQPVYGYQARVTCPQMEFTRSGNNGEMKTDVRPVPDGNAYAAARATVGRAICANCTFHDKTPTEVYIEITTAADARIIAIDHQRAANAAAAELNARDPSHDWRPDFLSDPNQQ